MSTITGSYSPSTFSLDSYYATLRDGGLQTASVFAPFIKIDRKKYNNLLKKTSVLSFSEIRRRLDISTYNQFRSSIKFCRKHESYFPAYRFIANECVNDEWLSMADWHKDFHRDHLIHQPLTAYVAHELMTGKLFETILGGKTLLSRTITILQEKIKCGYLYDYYKMMCGNADIFSKNKSSNSLRLGWLIMDTLFMAALFHDIGYPYRFISTLQSKLDFHTTARNPWHQGIEDIKRTFGRRLVFYPLSGYQKPENTAPADWGHRLNDILEEGLSKTHGMPGALAFLYLTDVLRRFPDPSDNPKRRFCVEWAAMAILMHDMAGLYATVEKDNRVEPKYDFLRLSFEKDPLSFILTLTDIIQDFARPSAVFYKTTTNEAEPAVFVDYHKRCKSVRLEWESSSNTLKIYYKYFFNSDYVKNRDEFIPKNQALYFDPQKGLLDYSGLGISRIKLFAEK